MEITEINNLLNNLYIAALPVEHGKKGYMFAAGAADYILGLLDRLNEQERIKVALADVDARLQESWMRAAIDLGHLWNETYKTVSAGLYEGVRLKTEEEKSRYLFRSSLVSAQSQLAAAAMDTAVRREALQQEGRFAERYLKEAESFREDFSDISSRIDRLSSALTSMTINGIVAGQSTEPTGGSPNAGISTD